MPAPDLSLSADREGSTDAHPNPAGRPADGADPEVAAEAAAVADRAAAVREDQAAGRA